MSILINSIQSGRFKTIFSLPYPADEFQKAAPLTDILNIFGVLLCLWFPLRLQCTEKVQIRDNPKAEPVRLIETYYAPKPTQDTPTDNANQPQPIERDFSIYAASYQDMPVMHRPYTNQYKFLVKDFCVHFINKWG